MGEIVFDDECEVFYLGKYTSLTSFIEEQTENCIKSTPQSELILTGRN